MRILITGANRGLGLALTTKACARGHQVFAGVRSAESSAERILALSTQFPEQIKILSLDVTNENSVRYASEQVSSQMSSLDVIINSAAILLGREQKLAQLDFVQVQQSFQTNLFGPMIILKYFLPLLKKGKHQAVVNISSEAGSVAGAYGGDYSYALSKAALNMFSAQLRQELKPEGVLVHAVHPGWIRTDMGGDHAPGNATESANGILDIIERKIEAENEALFIDHKGKAISI
ncbi:SDR family oxidoreductase [Paenibacillus sp. UASWS1643]|uniref:SDR family oxidoreductase n=1 Tax=Paenibacillus sp. UASWS1643 TaxID=2580422 RepID=UPI001238E0C1|nr:SDR family oxidoreductase [Paenibacillus sp. UASWS1643]KAA8745393.1 SDR family oxidoreductase [Paenibacillus sp. UASWS1643]